jgi:hypothetical protein
LNYLQLTNRAIQYAGADLDEITQTDFPDPETSLQRNFKEYVAEAWRDLQMELNNWEFKTKTAQLILRPRLLVVDGDRSVAPPAGSTYEGDDTGATFEVVDTVLLDGVWATGSAVAYIEYTDYEGQFKWHELYDETAPTPANTDVFRLKGWGKYDLSEEVTDLFEPNTSAFFVQSTGGSADQDNTANADNGYLVFLPWADWLVGGYEGDQVSRGRPQFFTKNPEGLYDFWPRLDQEYVFTFPYTAEPQELTLFNDEPEGLPSIYHDLIVWKAVMNWADYQQRPSDFDRAQRRYDSLYRRLAVNKKPKPSFAPNPYNCDWSIY